MKLLHVMVKAKTFVFVLQSDGVMHRKLDNICNYFVNIGRLEAKHETLKCS